MIALVWAAVSAKLRPYVAVIAAAAAAVVALAGAWLGFIVWLHDRDATHEAAGRAKCAAEQAAFVAKVQAADRIKADSALALAVQSERDASALAIQNRKANHDAPASTACVGSPAARAYLDRVRAGAGGSAVTGAAGGSAPAAGLPGHR